MTHTHTHFLKRGLPGRWPSCWHLEEAAQRNQPGVLIAWQGLCICLADLRYDDEVMEQMCVCVHRCLCACVCLSVALLFKHISLSLFTHARIDFLNVPGTTLDTDLNRLAKSCHPHSYWRIYALVAAFHSHGGRLAPENTREALGVLGENLWWHLYVGCCCTKQKIENVIENRPGAT